jgi:hypothetical protein
LKRHKNTHQQQRLKKLLCFVAVLSAKFRHNKQPREQQKLEEAKFVLEVKLRFLNLKQILASYFVDLATKNVIIIILPFHDKVKYKNMALVVLGTVAAFAIFAATTVTNAPYAGTVIKGDMGTFPGSAFTGFPPGIFTGDKYAAGSYAEIVKGDAQIAYESAAEQPVDTILSDTDLGGLTLTPGVYKFDDTAAMSQGELFLDAQEDSDAVWVFQIGSELNIAEGTGMFFTGGLGNANNVFWQVGTSATVNKGVSFIGNILAYSSISLKSQASVEGRLIALNGAVTLIDNSVSFPVASSSA